MGFCTYNTCIKSTVLKCNLNTFPEYVKNPEDGLMQFKTYDSNVNYCMLIT
jgi:hypothetical protein